MKNDLLYLQHISDALAKIITYTEQGRDAFMNQPMVQDAVIRNFEIIGEAAKRLSDTVKLQEPEIPWRSVSGFRDILIHDYMGVELNEVWNVIQFHIPALQQAVDRLLKFQISLNKTNHLYGEDLKRLSE